jgi:hypothetical protein
MSSLTNLEVKVTVDSGGITADPDTLQVPNGFDGTITWTLTGGEFRDPAITFDDEKNPSSAVSDRNTPTTRVRRWSNSLPKGAARSAYHYTLHAAPKGGERIEHDPTVENEPPNG